MRGWQYRFSVITFATGLMICTSSASGKSKKPKAPPPVPKDEIEVVGHVPVANGPVSRFLITQHYSSYYLYAEHESGGSVTLIDVTKIDRPSVLADVSYRSESAAGSLTVVAGTAALVTSAPPAPTSPPLPQTIKIMDFSDPRSPKVAREFAGVTAMSRDDRRGLIFLANGDGIWILQQRLAEDPEVERAYTEYLRYYH